MRKSMQIKKLMRRRIVKGEKEWHIAIDDGYCSFLYSLKASEKYSIDSLFKTIQKAVKK